MDEEIKDIEQRLRQLEVKGGFTVPPGYSEALPDSLFYVCASGERAEVPDMYFEKLSLKVMDRIEAAEKKEVKIIPLYANPVFKWVSGIAATLVMTLFVYYYAPKGPLPVTQEVSSSEVLGVEDVAAQIEAIDLDADYLCDAGWCNELEALQTEGKEARLDDYILNADEELLIEEL